MSEYEGLRNRVAVAILNAQAKAAAQGNHSHWVEVASEATLAEVYRTLKTVTPEMEDDAREWSRQKYGKPIGNDAAHGCWYNMLEASALKAPEPKP